MLTPQLQGGIGLPLVHVVERALADMSLDLARERCPVVHRGSHGLDPAIALDQAEHDHLAGRAETALAFACAAERRSSH